MVSNRKTILFMRCIRLAVLSILLLLLAFKNKEIDIFFWVFTPCSLISFLIMLFCIARYREYVKKPN
ncbi:MAG: hypothetical protein JWM44_4178 [Bacilli bacterium]|nr:hypothetical protein [Bacilli bacterium]